MPTRFRSVTERLPTVALAAILALVFAGGAGAQTASINIAVVDLDYIVSQSPSGKELQAQLEKFRQDVRAEAETRTAAMQDLRKRMAEGANSLSEDKLAELQRQYEDARIAIQRYQDDKQREGQKMQSEGLAKIEKQLEPAFKQIRDEEGYDLILNNVPGVVVMVGERVDITQKVIDKLNALGS